MSVPAKRVARPDIEVRKAVADPEKVLAELSNVGKVVGLPTHLQNCPAIIA